MSVENLLDEEIKSEFKTLGLIEMGTETYETVVSGVSKLLDKKIEFKKLEESSKVLNESRRERNWKNGIAIGTFIGSVVVYGLAYISSINFERVGTLTSEGGKGALRQFLQLIKIRYTS